MSHHSSFAQCSHLLGIHFWMVSMRTRTGSINISIFILFCFLNKYSERESIGVRFIYGKFVSRLSTVSTFVGMSLEYICRWFNNLGLVCTRAFVVNHLIYWTTTRISYSSILERERESECEWIVRLRGQLLHRMTIQLNAKIASNDQSVPSTIEFKQINDCASVTFHACHRTMIKFAYFFYSKRKKNIWKAIIPFQTLHFASQFQPRYYNAATPHA